MKNKWLIIGGAALALAALNIQATPITGSLGMAGGEYLDSTSVGTATTVLGWSGVTVAFPGGQGSFSGIAQGTSVSMAQPWVFNPSTALNGLWSVGGFTFDVATDSFGTSTVAGHLTLTVVGHGTISGNSYDPTPFDWIFTTQDPNIGAGVPNNSYAFTFSASTAAVPDGGATVMLLGAALSAMALIRRKLVA